MIEDIIRPQNRKQRPAVGRATTNSRPLNHNSSQHRVQPQRPLPPYLPIQAKEAPKRSKTKKKPSLRKRLKRIEKIILLLAAPLVILGTVRISKHAAIGEAIIAAYALAAVVCKIPSRVTFWLVSMFLVSIPAVLLSVPDIQRSHTAALYAFMLMGVGLLSLILETRRLEVQERRFR